MLRTPATGLALICAALLFLPAPAPAAADSRTDPALQEVLREHPEADTDTDGVLTTTENAAFRRRMKEGYKELVGHVALLAELGDALPVGQGVRLCHVEGGEHGQGKAGGWSVDASRPQFDGITFTGAGPASSHATGVAFGFYGSASMVPGVTEVECNHRRGLLYGTASFLRVGTAMLPDVTSARVANHSWIGRHGADRNLAVLRRLDYVVATDDFVQVAGANNGPRVPDLMQSSYNAIVVGKTDGEHSRGTNIIAPSVYCAGRAKPDIVAPARWTSNSSPIVASAAALLIGYAHDAGSGISHGSYRSPRTGGTVFHAETSEVVRAALMAGASRQTANSFPALGDVVDYGKGPDGLTANGLDLRYGAGQLNVRDSYRILAAGECDSAEDDGPAVAGSRGFDYDPSFGGLGGANRQATYLLPTSPNGAWLRASLVWNLRVEIDDGRWTGDAVLHDLDLRLVDVSDGGPREAAESASQIDNTENLWVELLPGRKYALVVSAAGGDQFEWDYGLAWTVAQGSPEAGQP